jgi:hypothetical protein
MSPLELAIEAAAARRKATIQAAMYAYGAAIRPAFDEYVRATKAATDAAEAVFAVAAAPFEVAYRRTVDAAEAEYADAIAATRTW